MYINIIFAMVLGIIWWEINIDNCQVRLLIVFGNGAFSMLRYVCMCKSTHYLSCTLLSLATR